MCKVLLTFNIIQSVLIDKMVALFFIFFFAIKQLFVIIIYQVKRRLALLESNQSRDRLDD
ncbi:MAG: hypothetical protein CVT96_12035 [Bacteroidetes bacterium HGW-Bacteroidetes-13]|nr:MAG: hypothetical protein CVT96_12035 [Bacteroidetes bacterium HGW-Bacteroidetes-13]